AVAIRTAQPSLSIILESGFGVSVETGEAPIRSLLELVEASPTWQHWRFTWPLDEALEQTATALVSTGHSARAGSLRLDVVVAWCREGLIWLTKLSGIMQRHSVRVFLYSKCYDDPEGELQRQGLPDYEQWQVIDLRDTPNFTTDECSAYLHYLLELHDDSASNHTMFLQGDALNHSPRGLLPMVMQSIAVGTYSLPFLHLGDLRQVVSESSCRSWLVHRYSLHTDGVVSTYCCAQFIVSRDRIAEVPKVSLRAMYEDVLSNSALPSDRCFSWPAQSTYCLWLEQLWHVIFGEPADLPLRSEDPRLPIFLRMSDEESFLPMRSNSSRRYPSIMFDFDAIGLDDSAYNPAPIPEFPLLGSALRIPCQQPLEALNIKPAAPRQIPSSTATRVAAQTSSRAEPWCTTVRARTSSVKLTAKDSTERQAGVHPANRATPGFGLSLCKEALNSGEHQATKV
ncbi:hypothetical protein FOZ63_033636, partial [Perkinsus olseni]